MLVSDELLKESETLEDKTILVRARVISKQEKTLTVRLVDGFGQTETVVHEDAALPDTATAAAA